MSVDDQKPVIDEFPKSSMEILSELFNSFDAEPPVIVKKEKSESPEKKGKKAKKKHKHKDKKHKKKDRKKKRERSCSSERSEIDLAEILIKQEKESSEKKIKIEGTDISFNLDVIKKEKENKKGKSKHKVKSEKKADIKKTKTECKSTKRKLEEGEVQSEDEKKSKRHRHKSVEKPEKEKKKHSKLSEERDLQLKINDLRNKLNRSSSKRSGSRGRSMSKENDFYSQKSRDKDRKRDKDRERDKNKDYDFKNRRKENCFYKEEESSWSRDRYRTHYDRDRDRRHRDHTPVRDSRAFRDSRDSIDKKKLLEIARKNAIQMMKSGSLPGAMSLGPQAQEKVIAAIKSGGKTVEELTEFCKTLSKKEELGELSSNSDGNGSDSDPDHAFHHPFQIKDRPTSITMNIKNSVPLPIKSTQERSSELRLQFPVSSGQLHRKTENEWVPVSPKKTETEPKPPETEAPVKEPETVVAETPAPATLLEPQAASKVTEPDISSIVSQRLTALRKLQENPHDVVALTQMYKSNKEMQSWAQSKQQPGQFTGTTGAQVLSQAELASGYQAWARKDQLTSATPVSGGMGMHLLQKMGWKPGEGLGKEKTGALEPLLLEVKLDKKGLVATEEQKKKKKQGQAAVNFSLQNKHPVSLLGEYASKRKLGAPQYNLCFECGPDHKKNFLFKVILNGVEYQPNVASPNKKEAKANAATVCLQHLGLLP